MRRRRQGSGRGRVYRPGGRTSPMGPLRRGRGPSQIISRSLLRRPNVPELNRARPGLGPGVGSSGTSRTQPQTGRKKRPAVLWLSSVRRRRQESGRGRVYRPGGRTSPMGPLRRGRGPSQIISRSLLRRPNVPELNRARARDRARGWLLRDEANHIIQAGGLTTGARGWTRDEPNPTPNKREAGKTP